MRSVLSWCLAISLLLSIAPAQSQAPTAAVEPFLMGFDESPQVFGTNWGLRIYTEAFKRMGVPLRAGFYPLARRAALADEGLIGGDGARVHGYGAAHPNLVRVEESVMDINFALFSARQDLQLQRLEDIASSGLMAEYRRGILLCENALKALVPPERLSNVTSEQQGLQKLLAGRTDVYCDLEPFIKQALGSLEIKDATRIRKIFGIGNLPTYPYLHKKHADLAPRLAATLKQMKAEGLIDTYRQQAEKDLGWAQ
jgi:polar amino acid transport system substrate-binding protein